MFGKVLENVPAPPDGWKAFVVACCGCLLHALNYGLSTSFGSFSNALHEDERLGNPSLNEVAIVASVLSGLGPILGMFSGLAVAKLGTRLTCMFGSICVTLSLILPPLLANSVMTLILTCSVFYAFGGFMVAASATATSTWFVKRKALGMGINFSGGGWGSLTIPYIAGVLQSKYDWRTSFLILSSLTVLSLISSFFVCLRRDPERETEENVVNEGEEESDAHPSTLQETSEVSEEVKPITDWRVARHEREFSPKKFFFHIMLTKDFIVLFLLMALFSTGFFAMQYSAVPYVSSMGKAGTIYADAPVVTIDRAVTVFILYGILRIIASSLMGYLASVHLGEKSVCTFSLGLYSITLLAWIACRQLWQHIIVMGLMGICIAGLFAAWPAMVGHKFHGPNLPIVMGIQIASSAVGGFAGPPLATALAVANNGEYTISLIVISMVILFATFLVAFGIDCDKVPCVCGRKENNNEDHEDHEVGKQSHIIGNSESSENEPISS